jgi:site-specific DNA-methyltransferase (adenine-specific)
MIPYYTDEAVTLYHGDCLDLLDRLDLTVDCIVTDPPYGETSLAWDRWPAGWPTAVSGAARSMWCFGSLRMFLDRRDDFVFWKLSQDVVWRKPRPLAVAGDRFARAHELAAFWYRGDWASLYREVMTRTYSGPPARVTRHDVPVGVYGAGTVAEYIEPGVRLVETVIEARSPDPRVGLHPTQKPVGILDLLIRYACPPGGTVLDLFAGSGSTAEAARLCGRRAVLIEADERYCEAIARRMSQGVLIAEPDEAVP